VRAQTNNRATINGTVRDATGGALPGVTVTLKSPAMQVQELDKVTDERGEYQFIDLAPGEYRVDVQFYLQKASGDYPRMETSRQRWLVPLAVFLCLFGLVLILCCLSAVALWLAIFGHKRHYSLASLLVLTAIMAVAFALAITVKPAKPLELKPKAAPAGSR
jgi:hypothetical protein